MWIMQYRFELPAGYPMDSVRQRVRERAHLFEGYPGLRWKAFLLSQQGVAGAEANAYAPVYLWEDAGAALGFLQGPLFAAVTQAFSWVPVRFGLLAQAARGPAQGQLPRWCTVRELPVPRHTALVRLSEPPAIADAACESRYLALDTGAWCAREFVFGTEPPAPSAGAHEVVAFARGAAHRA